MWFAVITKYFIADIYKYLTFYLPKIKFGLFWFKKSWWQYALEKPLTFRKFFCRIAGHPEGIVFYNSYGCEPDTTCKNCGDEL
jgi:hypothetical protein